MLDLLVSSLTATAIGLVLGVILQRRVEKCYAWLRYFVRRHLLGRAHVQRLPEEFSLGGEILPFVILDGDGSGFYSKENLTCRLAGTSRSELPEDIAARRRLVEAREEAKRAKGCQAAWNGPIHALEYVNVERTVPREEPKLTLGVSRSDYFAFQATVASLDEAFPEEQERRTLRQRYIEGSSFKQPITALAQGFGVCLLVLGSDEQLALVRRSKRCSVRPDEIDVSVVEGLHPDLDRASTHPGPDPFRTATRGAWEELGLVISEDDVRFLGIGVDTEHYQWNLLGVAVLRQKLVLALDQRSRGTGGKWENRDVLCIGSDPGNVFDFLRYESLWATGWVTLYWGLVSRYGRRGVDSAARRHLLEQGWRFKRRSEPPLV